MNPVPTDSTVVTLTERDPVIIHEYWNRICVIGKTSEAEDNSSFPFPTLTLAPSLFPESFDIENSAGQMRRDQYGNRFSTVTARTLCTSRFVNYLSPARRCVIECLHRSLNSVVRPTPPVMKMEYPGTWLRRSSVGSGLGVNDSTEWAGFQTYLRKFRVRLTKSRALCFFLIDRDSGLSPSAWK